MIRTTDYFDRYVLPERGYLTPELMQRVIDHPIATETQPNGRIRHWAEVPELGGRFLRVVTLPDRVTVHNAFLDRNFTRRYRRSQQP